MRAALLIAALTLSAEAQTTYRWSSDATTEYLAKAGNDREVIFGARLEGSVTSGRWTIGLRAQASAKPDGGAREGSVSFEDPHTFDSIGGYLSTAFEVKKFGKLSTSVACVAGLEADVEGGRVRVFEQYPLTYGCGARLGLGGAYLYGLVGEHEAAGPGIKGLVTLRIPVVKRAALIANGAIGGPRSFALVGVALGVGGEQ